MHRTLIWLVLPVVLAVPSRAAPRLSETQQTWEKVCSKCHGLNGKGQTPQGKKAGIVDLTDPNVQKKFSDDQMFKSIKQGVKDSRGNSKMKPVENLTDPEIRALIAYVRRFNGK